MLFFYSIVYSKCNIVHLELLIFYLFIQFLFIQHLFVILFIFRMFKLYFT